MLGRRAAGWMAGAVLLVDAGASARERSQLRLLHVEPWARGARHRQAPWSDECVVALRPRAPATSGSACGPTRRARRARGASTRPPASRIVETAIHHEFGKPEQGETCGACCTELRDSLRPLCADAEAAALLPFSIAADRRPRPAGTIVDAPRRDPDARLHAGRHRGDGQGDEARRRARQRRRHHPRQHLSSDAAPRRRADRAARRPARLHGLGAADPDRQRRLSGDEPLRADAR